MPPLLTDDEVARFRADGYLLPGRQLIAPEKLDSLEAIFNEHLADKGGKLSDELDTPHYRDERHREGVSRERGSFFVVCAEGGPAAGLGWKPRSMMVSRLSPVGRSGWPELRRSSGQPHYWRGR